MLATAVELENEVSCTATDLDVVIQRSRNVTIDHTGHRFGGIGVIVTGRGIIF